MNELNEKLAKWAGFLKGKYDQWAPPHGFRDPVGPVPDFTADLNACFKWLVPKANSKRFSVEIWAGDNGRVSVDVAPSLSMNGRLCNSYNDEHNPALAFCLAIEKLIDAEGSDERVEVQAIH